MARYSLADYSITVKLPSNLAAEFGVETISVGGENSYTSSISVAMNSSLWSTSGDNTGSFVHTKNLDRTGTCSVSLNQMSTQVAKFIRLCNIFYRTTEEYDGLTITVNSSQNIPVCICDDCYINKIPDQSFGNTPSDQTWQFTCGRITFVD